MSILTFGEARTATVGSRTVAWTTYGDPAGTPLVHFHGAGGSRWEGAYLDADAAAAGIRVIAVDRPGCGRTDPMPSRTLLRSVGDLSVVLDAEQVNRFAVSGLSAGAMYAWAAGEAFADRVTRVVPISPPANSEPYADVRAAFAKQFKASAFLSSHAPGLLAAIQRKQSKTFDRPDGHARFVKTMRKISPDDATLLEDKAMFDDFRAISTEGRRQGFMGGEEFRLAWQAWGFDPAAQTVPCTVVFGTTDPLTPPIRLWLKHAPQVIGVEVPGGHLQTSIPTGRAAIIDALKSSAA
ncbi:MAG TPA: alpha/beta hydrolase [Mycobacteriales bacterium]|nr:alpha/beta hydrolase [Mycobacteriales bacterium]